MTRRVKEFVDKVYSGSGTLFPCHIGVWHSCQAAGVVAKRVAGTSGGAAVAAAEAHGMDPRDALELAKKLLGPSLLDRSWWPLRSYGLHGGAKIHKQLKKVFPGRMSEADLTWGVFVVDLEKGRPVWVNSKKHGHVKTADAVMASMAIPLFFKMRKIHGMKGTFVDGGASINFGMEVWDDVPSRRTVGSRFQHSDNPERKKIENIVDYTRQMMGVLVDNANHTHVSRKRWADVIQIKSAGDGMSFDVDEEWVEARFMEGVHAGDRFFSGERQP